MRLLRLRLVRVQVRVRVGRPRVLRLRLRPPLLIQLERTGHSECPTP